MKKFEYRSVLFMDGSRQDHPEVPMRRPESGQDWAYMHEMQDVLARLGGAGWGVISVIDQWRTDYIGTKVVTSVQVLMMREIPETIR
jgi:hypothetical protein